MSRISSFKSIENKHDVYRGKDCMKNKYVKDKKYCKVSGHSIITFALEAQGAFHQNANMCEKGEGECHVNANVRI